MLHDSYKVKCSGGPSCDQCEKNRIICQFNFSAKENDGERRDLTAAPVEEIQEHDENEAQNLITGPSYDPTESDAGGCLPYQASHSPYGQTVRVHPDEDQVIFTNEQVSLNKPCKGPIEIYCPA